MSEKEYHEKIRVIQNGFWEAWKLVREGNFSFNEWIAKVGQIVENNKDYNTLHALSISMMTSWVPVIREQMEWRAVNNGETIPKRNKGDD